ncbi:MAG: TetR/AcrR family transcriptional regulator [Caulobacter sp.]|nr:TetR/AcrR family transcriptional regulator [Caulobacter sp.]
MAQSAPVEHRSRRTQAERRDQSERGLLMAASEVIAERGVTAATFGAIGARAGYSRGLATQKFGSKQGLIEALIAHLHARQDEVLGALGIDAMPGLEALLTYVDLYLRDLALKGEARAYFMLLAGAVADLSALRAAFAASHERVERRLEAMVQRGQAQGAIRRDLDADAAALMVGSLLLGLSIQCLIDPDMDLEPIRATSLATLRLSFAAPASPEA